ncbi:hypothetical protein [Nocardia alni]|uniref:hypothetical protein n=1 Tax=Nocardia alni TaxID=2815723 RepID=UPI001C23937E|nr:hypothetical protein [Nocardia alni]
MTGTVPVAGPARPILQAAFLLATVDHWITPDIVTTDDGVTGANVLSEVGIANIADVVRAHLIDRINHAAADCALGPLVDRVARAWQQYRRTTPSTAPGEADGHQQATVAFITARAAYTRQHRKLYPHTLPARHSPTTRTADFPGLHE